MSAQPLTTDPTTQGVITQDAAIHLFYDLDEATWADVLARLAALKAIAGSSTSGAPLGVHPTMQAQGLTGPYAQALAAAPVLLPTRETRTSSASPIWSRPSTRTGSWGPSSDPGAR